MSKNNVHTIGNVSYVAKGRIWEFNSENFQFRRDLPGGRETADKVASIINGSLKRSENGVLDGLGRANIHKILASATAGRVSHTSFPEHRFSFVAR